MREFRLEIYCSKCGQKFLSFSYKSRFCSKVCRSKFHQGYLDSYKERKDYYKKRYEEMKKDETFLEKRRKSARLAMYKKMQKYKMIEEDRRKTFTEGYFSKIEGR